MKKSLFAVALSLAFFLLLTVGYRADYPVPEVNFTPRDQVLILQTEVRLGVFPGTNKTFDWRFPDRRKTSYSLVQLHGWSASRREISPVAEELARRFGMNLFMTRFCGHGLGFEGMREAKAECMIRDAEEAMAVGKAMGEKVILLGTSTGAALALHLARRHSEVAGLVFVSPNFRPASFATLFLKGPLGPSLANWLVGEHRWTPKSSDEERFWTTSYPATALVEMMNLLSWTNRIDLRELKTPLLTFMSPQDEVVSVDLIRDAFKAYGGPQKLVEIEGAPHVLAGDILYPDGTPEVLSAAEDFFVSRFGLASDENAGTSAQNQ